jgi:5-methyltetrahydropteroyltriglutamate--homocysteine methyltransferase
MRRSSTAAERLFVPAGAGGLPLPAGSIETAQSHLDTSVLAQLQGKQILVGCIDLSDMNVETPEVIAERVRRALKHVQPEHVVLAPDCGMKYLPREVAQGKLASMVQARTTRRREYGHAAVKPLLLPSPFGEGAG